jgi:hypothetical protein
MRAYILSAILFFTFIPCFAQKVPASLAMDERGKYIFYEVVEDPLVSKDSLVNRSRYFFEVFKKKNLKLNSSDQDSLFKAEGKFVINKGGQLLSHPSGEMAFNFVAEIRDGRYRYWLTDFKYVPYKRDRYGNFVPESTIPIPLEKNLGKLNAGQWKDNLAAAANQSHKFGENFKRILGGRYLKNPVDSKPKSISKEQW